MKKKNNWRLKPIFVLLAFVISVFGAENPSFALGQELICDDYKNLKNEYENTYCQYWSANQTEPRMVFKKIRDQYHQDTNTQLNTAIDKIAGTDFSDDPNRSQVAQLTNILEVYTARSIELRKYQAALHTMTHSNAIASCAQEEQPATLRSAIGCVSIFREELELESQIAEAALNITLQSYSEMRYYYPLHKELEALIEELQRLRNSWTDFVWQITRMPAKFINAGQMCR